MEEERQEDLVQDRRPKEEAQRARRDPTSTPRPTRKPEKERINGFGGTTQGYQYLRTLTQPGCSAEEPKAPNSNAAANGRHQ